MAKEVKNIRKENAQEVIDATSTVVGRLASFAAKKALLGNRVIIINSEKAIVIGKKENILQKYKAKILRGKGKQKGPYFPRKPEAILRMAIRGMLPYDKKMGREAFKDIKCYVSIPPELKDAEKIQLGKDISADSITLEEVSRLI